MMRGRNFSEVILFRHALLSSSMTAERKGPADTTTSRPVNPQVRTRPGAPANFRPVCQFLTLASQNKGDRHSACSRC
jgi:hypothetical protein